MLKNPKIVGAFLVGFALVAGSFIISTFGQSQVTDNTPFAVASEPIPRVYIEVSDKDNNGIEDWREEFVAVEPLILPPAASTTVFETPTTVTDQVGIQFFESILRAKGQGGIGPTEEEVIENTAERLRATANDVLYDTVDLTIVPVTPEGIRTYANTLATILTNNNVSNYEDELVIVDRALKMESEAELDKLDPLIAMYKNMRDQTLATPVPAPFVKEHLDLINVYQALYKNLSEMKLALEDPVVALMRIQRYQDDATGLANALTNMYKVLIPHADLFTESDPAVLLVIFAPDYQ